MPRLSHTQCRTNLEFVQLLWRCDHALLRFLTVAEQRDLFTYYPPHLVLAEPDVADQRRQATQLDKGLPQRAAKALAHLEQALAVPVPMHRRQVQVPSGRRVRAGTISSRAVLRPVPDAWLLARALLDIARDEMERRQRDAG